MIKYILGTIAILTTAFYISCNITYSEGERVGYLRKLSTKGFVCKTVEGELSLQAQPNTVAEVFNFTVDDDYNIDLKTLDGKLVVVTYKQLVYNPSCFGDTNYIVTNVEVLK